MARPSDRSVLLVIDVQNDFCPGGSLEVREGDRVVPVINKIMNEFRRVIATQDWHPQNHVSFASNHEGKKALDSVIVNGIEQVLWPDHCVRGTRGADFHPELDVRFFNLIVRKGTDPAVDSYSAFFENDRKTSTGLSYYLKGFGVKEVYISGLATDYCEYYSAMDSAKLGFKTFLIEDASRGVDFPEGSIEKAKQQMRAQGIEIIHSGDYF